MLSQRSINKEREEEVKGMLCEKDLACFAGFEDGGNRPQAKSVGLYNLERARNRFSPRTSRKEHSLLTP